MRPDSAPERCNFRSCRSVVGFCRPGIHANEIQSLGLVHSEEADRWHVSQATCCSLGSVPACIGPAVDSEGRFSGVTMLSSNGGRQARGR